MKLRKTLLLTIVMAIAATAAALLFAFGSPSASAADPIMPPVDPGTDPLAGVHYMLDCGSVGQGYFTEIDNIGSESEIVEHRIINELGVEVIQKIPGRLKFNNITLRRGITGNMDMWTWRKLVEDGLVNQARTNCSVTLLNQELTPIAQFTLTNAWPVSIAKPALDADGVTVEEIVLVCEGYQRVQ